MPFKITGTSPSGSVWHHSSHYATRRGVASGLARVVEQEAARAAEKWLDVEARSLGMLPGESIELPNGWTFTIDETVPENG